MIYFYLTCKNHILIAPYKNATGIKVEDQRGWYNVLESSKVLNQRLAADPTSYDRLPSRGDPKAPNAAAAEQDKPVEPPYNPRPLGYKTILLPNLAYILPVQLGLYPHAVFPQGPILNPMFVG